MQARNARQNQDRAAGAALRDAGPLPPADLAAMRAALVAALGQGAAMIETPLIGRVEFRTVDEIQTAIAWIDSQNPATASTPRTFVAQSNRGTWGGC